MHCGRALLGVSKAEWLALRAHRRNRPPASGLGRAAKNTRVIEERCDALRYAGPNTVRARLRACGETDQVPNIQACDAGASALDHGEPVGGPQQMIVYHCEQH
jgi:hypothetical protein